MPSHVFLFRHCVRSTETDVHLFHPNKRNYSENAQDYIDEPLPDWNTPPMWCTKRAMDVLRGTGAWLVQQSVKKEDDNNDGRALSKRLRVRMISDTAQRDVDTSLALSLGMTDAMSNLPSSSWMGVDQVNYGPALFRPLKPNNYTPTSLCPFNQSAASSSMKHDIRKRFRTVSPPSIGLNETLQLLHALGGLHFLDPTLTLNARSSGTKLEGAVNLVTLYAQMAFYSRAGGIEPPFLPNATLHQVYSMLQWVGWSRSVLQTNNAKAAHKGAVLAATILEALEREDTVTILVGHDGDLDDVATAFGVRWKLSPPYQCEDAEYKPTPPGSGMHFSLKDDDDTAVAMSFVYPVYLRHDQPLNTSGILESTPLQMIQPGDATIRTDATTTYLEEGTAALKRRLFSILQEYPGSLECYHAAANYSQVMEAKREPTVEPSASKTSSSTLFAVFAAASVCLMISSFLLGRRGRERTRKPRSVYNEVGCRASRDLELS